jgi:hypothetical protein
MAMSAPFEQLDYIYAPSTDVAAEARRLVDLLGARLVFAIEGMGARVAMLELAEGPPHLLLASHLAGQAPVLVYRVADIDAARNDLKSKGFSKGDRLELPMGPAFAFEVDGHRFAIYERSRPAVVKSFAGRRDF